MELWPLMASELCTTTEQRRKPTRPLLDRLIAGKGTIDTVLLDEPEVLLGSDAHAGAEAIEHLAAWGGMPELLRLSEEQRHEWLRSYQQTYLERDLADLVRLSDLDPFHTLQRIAMLRSGGLLSYAELAREAGLAVSTARRYLEYLRLSYQVLLLPPYARNLTSTVVKAPKLYWTDLGLLRQGTRQWGDPSGEMFETLVVVEIHKWIVTSGRDAGLFFYRTRSGMEVDLLVETPTGVIGIEVKTARTVGTGDHRALRAVGEELGKAWRGGIVLHRGTALEQLDPSRHLWAVPVERLLCD